METSSWFSVHRDGSTNVQRCRHTSGREMARHVHHSVGPGFLLAASMMVQVVLGRTWR